MQQFCRVAVLIWLRFNLIGLVGPGEKDLEGDREAAVISQENRSVNRVGRREPGKAANAASSRETLDPFNHVTSVKVPMP